MAKSTLLNTETVNLQDLLSNGRVYEVPPYQRDYSWETEHWEDLWLDIQDLEANREDQHYMGAVVFQKVSDRKLQIIDGQQRLATLSILILAVIQELRALVEEGIETNENEERIQLLMSQFLGFKDPASLKYSAKLILNENDRDFYKQYLLQFRSPVNERSLRGSIKSLWDAYRFYRQKIQDQFEGNRTGKALATFLDNVVARRLMFIRISVEDELRAYTVFETLNARGLELTSADLLKNYLFSQVARESKADLEHVRAQWKVIADAIGMRTLPEFLRHFLNSKQRYVRRERLFKVIKQDVRTSQQVFDLLDDLEKASVWYKALEDEHDEFWHDYDGAYQEVRILRLFRVKQYKPLVLAAGRRLPSNEIRDLLRVCRILSFRYNMVSQRNTNDLEDRYNRVAVEVSEGRLASLRDIKDALSPIYIPDEEFRADFSNLSINTRGSKKRLAKYILCCLENHLSQTDLDFETASATIEHIFPENPNDDWRDAFREDERDRFVYRLGNLTLLELPLNREHAGNAGIQRKVPVYRRSQYSMTNRIDIEEWTPESIHARQREMAGWASAIWSYQ